MHDVIGVLQNGETVDRLTGTCLPTLTKAEVYECLAYYEDHRGEIDLLVAPDGARARSAAKLLLDQDVPEDLTYLSHLVHYRGRLSVYLRLLDVPVPGSYGPTADER